MKKLSSLVAALLLAAPFAGPAFAASAPDAHPHHGTRAHHAQRGHHARKHASHHAAARRAQGAHGHGTQVAAASSHRAHP